MGRWIGQNRYYLLIALALLAVTAVAAVLLVPDWFWHPEGYCSGTPAQIRGCKGYNFHSGVGGEFGELTLLAGIATFWFKHNCYEHGCPWLGRVKGDDDHLRCKGHHRQSHPEYPH